VHDGKIDVQVTEDITDNGAGTRTLTLQIDHPGVIWPGTFLASAVLTRCAHSH
jgi:hypothetical protein